MKRIKRFTDAGTNFRIFRKKPLVISAIQMKEDFEVETLEGIMKGKVGDFLIKGIKGELYACDRDIFLESYKEEIEEGLFKS